MYEIIAREKIIALREESGKTQQYVADKINITQVQLSKIERGYQKIDIDTLGKIADFYNVSTDWIMGRAKKTTN